MTIAANPAVATALRRAASRATLAPSVHNTQPWRFVVTTESVEIRSDRTRQLNVLDPTRRKLLISCGCALFNARVAIAAAGFEPKVERLPDPQDPDLLARVSVGEARDWVPIGALDPAIDDRRTNRRAFADEAVPPSVVYDLVSAARSENSVLIPITEPSHRHAAANLCRQANDIQNSDPAYIAELVAWTTDDPRRVDGVQAVSVPYAGDPTVAGDALPIRTFDVQGLGWLPSSSGSNAEQCLLLLAATDDSPETWLRTGEALERVWLTLTTAGYAASPLTSVVEVAQTRNELRTALRTELHPQLLLRVGLAPSTVRTRRRDVRDVIRTT